MPGAFRLRGPGRIDRAAVAIAAVLAAWILFAPVRALVVTIVYDDAFYYFGVADNLVRGHGPTFDGMTTTNGFHPLWLAVLVPLRVAIADRDAFVRAAVLLSALCAASAFAAMRRFLREYHGPENPLIPYAGWVFPFAFLLSAFGLETWLAVALLVALLRRTLAGGPPGSGRRHLATGSLAAACVLARVDLLPFAVALLAVRYARIRRSDPAAGGMRTALALAAPGLAFVGGYALVSIAAFGDWRSISMAAKSTTGLPFGAPAGTTGMAHVRAILSIRVFAVLCALPFAAFAIAAARRRWDLVVLALCGIVHFALASFVLAWGEQLWYFIPYTVAFLAALPCVAGPGIGRILASRRVRYACAAVLVLAYVGAIAAKARLDDRDRTQLAMESFARALRDLTHPRDRIATPFAGMIGWFGERDVLGLDGLMADRAYLDAAEHGRIADFLDARGIAYVAPIVRGADLTRDAIPIPYLDGYVVRPAEALCAISADTHPAISWVLARWRDRPPNDAGGRRHAR